MSMAALRWARSVRGISGTQKLVLWALADMANDYGEAWPSALAMADDCCLSDRAVRDALDALEACGLIAGERAVGRATRWCIRIGRTPEPRAETPERPAVTPERRSALPAARSTTPHPGTWFRPTPEPASDPPRNVVPTTPERGSDRTLNNPHTTLIEPSTRASGEAFEAWWKHYPRKVGKDAARTAYAAALKRGATHATLAAALQRQRWPNEPQFIPHARTWLTQGRWQDDPEAAAPAPATASDRTWWADPRALDADHRPAFDFDATAEALP
jgi:hypothetical protein